MSWGSRVLVSCLLVANACAGDNRLDPGELELRDVLGVSPETAMAWDADQRASARQVIDAGMHEAQPASHASFDRSIANSLAVADNDRAKHRLGAMGVVELAVGRDELQATPHSSTLAPRATAPIELELAGWTDRPGWALLPARGLDVLSSIAIDAGHRGGPIIVTPAPQLAVIAGYVPATPSSAARLYVNPVLLASLEPVEPIEPRAVVVVAVAAPNQPVKARGPSVLAEDAIGNPYSFYTSVAECAAAQASRCQACLPNSTCTPIAGSGDGNAECAQLAANQGRGYSLICINFALAINSVESCAATQAPTCPIDPHAGEQISALEHNADFLDKPGCAGSLDVCLGNVFGTPTSSPTTSPNNSADCSDSACAASPSCDNNGCADGASCDDSSGSTGADSGCSSDNSSSCDSGGDSGGDCSSSDSSGCSDSSGGGCSNSSSSGCSDSSSSGCSGGDSGGDCSGGGGNDCDAGGHHRHGTSTTSFLWACLPLPFAVIARRRADRRRAKREVAS